jgi:hypothetical protein
MGEPSGHGKGGADHRPSRDDLGRAGLNSAAWRACTHRKCIDVAYEVTLQKSPA